MVRCAHKSIKLAQTNQMRSGDKKYNSNTFTANICYYKNIHRIVIL